MFEGLFLLILVLVGLVCFCIFLFECKDDFPRWFIVFIFIMATIIGLALISASFTESRVQTRSSKSEFFIFLKKIFQNYPHNQIISTIVDQFDYMVVERDLEMISLN